MLICYFRLRYTPCYMITDIFAAPYALLPLHAAAAPAFDAAIAAIRHMLMLLLSIAMPAAASACFFSLRHTLRRCCF